MSVAVAVVFVMQGYSQIRQQEIQSHIGTLETTTLTEDEIEEKVDDKLLTIQSKILELERRTQRENEKFYSRIIELLESEKDAAVQ